MNGSWHPKTEKKVNSKNAHLCSYSPHGFTWDPCKQMKYKVAHKKRAKVVVCLKFETYLLADWSNLILHIHDDYS